MAQESWSDVRASGNFDEVRGTDHGAFRNERVACCVDLLLTSTNLPSYCLRRGIAFELERSVSVETRKWFMGHKDSKAFEAYQSKIATVDLQSIFRGLEQNSSTIKISSISLANVAGAQCA